MIAFSTTKSSEVSLPTVSMHSALAENPSPRSTIVHHSIFSAESVIVHPQTKIAPRVHLTTFGLDEHPFPTHGATILKVSSFMAESLRNESYVRLDDKKCYRIKELKKVDKDWIVFRCDVCGEDGNRIAAGPSILIAVCSQHVHRKLLDRMDRWIWERKKRWSC
jgi:hypothetical protein